MKNTEIKDEFKIKLNESEKLQEKYPELIPHKGFNWFDRELKQLGFRRLDTFIVGKSLFLAYHTDTDFLYIQQDFQGRTFDVYLQINFTRLPDILLKLKERINESKIIHTKPEQRKNVFTRISNFLLYIEKFFYARK